MSIGQSPSQPRRRWGASTDPAPLCPGLQNRHGIYTASELNMPGLPHQQLPVEMQASLVRPAGSYYQASRAVATAARHAMGRQHPPASQITPLSSSLLACMVICMTCIGQLSHKTLPIGGSPPQPRRRWGASTDPAPLCPGLQHRQRQPLSAAACAPACAWLGSGLCVFFCSQVRAGVPAQIQHPCFRACQPDSPHQQLPAIMHGALA